jgi:tol-pal system protein YbgF
MMPNKDKCKGPEKRTPIAKRVGVLKYRTFFIPFLFIFLIPLFSCVPETELINLNDQVIALNKKVSKLEASQTSTRDIDSELEPLRAGQASSTADLEQIRGAIDAQSGRIEDMEHIVKNVIERDLGGLDEMQSQLTLMREKVSELELMVQQQQQYLKLEQPAAKRREEPTVRATPQRETAPPAAVIPVKPKSSELALYDSSLTAYRAGQFQDARAGFQDFLKRYPKSDLADNAYFWIGESYMSLNRYEQAILAYQEVIKKYPKGNKVPSALLRQAMAFIEIKDEIAAKHLLKKIIKNYPKSNEAKIAQTRLKNLSR